MPSDLREVLYPILPTKWECTALLHPFSPPPDPSDQTSPFFQICVAFVSYVEGQVLSIQVKGFQHGAWWYKVTPQETTVSLDQGSTWNSIDMGWLLPTKMWLGKTPEFFATTYLNWMQQKVDWWKAPSQNLQRATWMWFDHETGHPFRIMFGSPPPSPVFGNPQELAFFQNFSFTYFASFALVESPNVKVWSYPHIPGLQIGNLDGRQLPVWNNCFSMTTLMTPVDWRSLPLPTIVLYQWKPDDDYQVTTDRSQSTVMSYENNKNAGQQTEVALLYGVAPNDTYPPPRAGSGYIYKETDLLNRGRFIRVILCRSINLGQQPPYWARIPSIKGTIHGSITNHESLCPRQSVNIISAIFPPTHGYPQGRYLWTWYSPLLGSDGTSSRPVWFGESASNVKEGGTCLALADYFDYKVSTEWFPAHFFKLPSPCANPSIPQTNSWVDISIKISACIKTIVIYAYFRFLRYLNIYIK